MTIADRWRALCDRVGEAALRSGRRPETVTIVAAAKTFGAAEVAEAIAAGAADVGENYVQEAVARRRAIAAPARWHMIGRLQRNKAVRAVETFDWIHSVDSVDLIEALDRAAQHSGRSIRGLVQVNLGGEATKGGVRPDSLEALFAAATAHRSLTIEGLMTIPPPVDHPEGSRRYFAEMRELLERVARLRLPGVQPKELSMGMSADFEVAVEEGATFVRIGTALFGSRERRR